MQARGGSAFNIICILVIVRSFIRSFVRSFVRSSVCLQFVRSFVQSLLLHALSGRIDSNQRIVDVSVS